MEQEIRKSLHHILREVRRNRKSVWKRIGEILIEMGIIVFAVSFAVFMEKQREYKHEQREVKEFLIGLRTDLRNDIHEMLEDKKGYMTQSKWFRYFSQRNTLNKDSLLQYQWVLWSTTHLLVNGGRYSGFKESGKMNTIENEQLRNNILDLYEETLVSLTNTTAAYISLKRDFQKLVYKLRIDEGGASDNLQDVLKNEEIRNYCLRLRYANAPIDKYDSAISKSEKIIELINKEYPEK